MHKIRAYNPSAWALRYPFFVFVFFGLLIVSGIWAGQKLPLTRYPHVDVPVIAIKGRFSEKIPHRFEEHWIKPFEQRLLQIKGVKHVYTALLQNFFSFTVEFQGESLPTDALERVRQNLALYQKDSAQQMGGLGVSVSNLESDFAEVIAGAELTYGVLSSTLSPVEVTALVEKEIVPRLKHLEGVEDVRLFGGARSEIQVRVDPRALAEKKLPLLEVATQLSKGRQGEETLEQIKGLPLNATKTITLQQVSEVGLYEKMDSSFASLDGKPVLAFSVIHKRGASDVAVAKNVSALLNTLKPSLLDLQITQIDSSAPYTLGNFYSALHTLGEGALLTVFVVFVFLRNWRATIIAALTLPLSIFPTLLGMYILGFSLNLVSLLGIVIVTGILVDDAIVELENVFRHMRGGKAPYQATLQATHDIGITIVAISAAIVAVFIPVSFMGGIAGRFFTHFGLTVSLAVFFSLLVARFVTPVLTAYCLRPLVVQNDQETASLIKRFYLLCLQKSLHWKGLTFLCGVLIFCVSLGVLSRLPTGFLPEEDTSRVLLKVVPLKEQDQKVLGLDLSQKFSALPEIAQVFVRGGQEGEDLFAVQPLFFVIHLKEKKQRLKTQAQTIEDLAFILQKYHGLQVSFINELSGQRDVTLALLANEENEADLFEQARKVGDRLRTFSSLRRVEVRIPPIEERFFPKFSENVDEKTRATVLETFPLLRGAHFLRTAFYQGQQLPLMLDVHHASFGSPPKVSEDTSALLAKSLWIKTATGELSQLSSLAQFGSESTPALIVRQNGHRMVSIEADLASGASLGEVVSEIKRKISLGSGFSLLEMGDFETMQETLSSFQVALALGGGCVFFILLALLGSFLQAAVVLISLPLSLAGAFFALYIFKLPLDMPVSIGLLMLVGIVTKNAIMLVDCSGRLMDLGLPTFEALVAAGSQRVRPIMMTTLAMIAGLLPGALAWGEGGEFRSPMAIAVIGGLFVSTCLSLFFVPALSLIFWKVRFFVEQKIFLLKQGSFFSKGKD